MKVEKPPVFFTYFGAKRNVVEEVWKRFGRVKTIIEPFCGSAAVSLACPFEDTNIVLNDIDGLISNFFRAVRAAPEEVAKHAFRIKMEVDAVAAMKWLAGNKESIQNKLKSDIDWYDARAAGLYAFVMSCVLSHRIISSPKNLALYNTRSGVTKYNTEQKLIEDLTRCSQKMRSGMVLCRNWEDLMKKSFLFARTPTAIFLDPPYSYSTGRAKNIYENDDGGVSEAVRRFAIDHGNDTRLRIAVCGFDGEHDFPETWERFAWEKTRGYSGFGGARVEYNNHKIERIWFSPHCLKDHKLI